MFKFPRGHANTVDQEPYELHEKWTTGKISEMSEGGVPSPRWTPSDKTWRIICYPKGYKKANDYFSIFLYCPKLKEDHSVKFTIQTVGGKKTAKKEAEYTFSSTVSSRGFTDFIPLTDINSYTVDGQLTFQVDIIFSPPQSTVLNYRKKVGHIGLENQGCTCYMNSALECLFHTCAFRKIVFNLPTKGDEDITKNIPLALQRLFILLQKSTYAPSTQELTKAFGWGTLEVFLQHDVQEFLSVLIDNIEKKMKETDNAGAIAGLFRGKTIKFIKCMNVDYTSEKTEDFYSISLPVKNKNNIEESLKSYIQDEILDGKNQYEAEGYGKVDAVMGIRFLELPPVLHVHLERFDYDYYTGRQIKIPNRFEFPFELDMEPYLSDKASHDECYTYELFSVLVHLGTVYGGHYYAFARTSSERKWFKFDDDAVSIVDEKTAIEDNFGGKSNTNIKMYSAYYLVYIRKTDIDRIMAPVTNDDIPQHLLDYYQEWKSQHSGLPPSIYLQILTQKTYEDSIKINGKIPQDINSKESIKTPREIRFLDLVPEIKRRAGIDSDSEVELWVIGQYGFPIRPISPECKISQHFQSSSKIFVTTANNESSNVDKKNERFLFVSFYDPASNEPLKFIKHVVLDVNSNLLSLVEEVRSIMKIHDSSAKLITYYFHSNDKVEEINPESALKESNINFGMIVFQLENGHVALDTENATENSDEKIYKSFSLLPEYKAETFIDYNSFFNSATQYSFAHLEDPNIVKFKLLIDSSCPLGSFLRCVRKMLNLSDKDSVLLFPKDPTKGVPSKRQINFSMKSTIQQVITTKSLYFKIIENVSQEELEKKISFRVQIVNENLEVIETPILLMPSKFQVDDVIGKVKELKIVPQDKPVRFLQLVGSRIIKIMDQDTELTHQIDFQYRIEMIPEDQIDCPDDHLVRVTLSTDLTVPITGCVGTPFIFRIEDDEKFSQTKERLSQIIKESVSKLSFAYTNNYINMKEFKMLKDDDILSELLKGNQTMIYAFLPVDHRRTAKNKPFSWNSGVSIYN